MKQRAARLRTDLLEAPVELAIDAELGVAGPVRAKRRPGTLRWQFDRGRQIGERRQPIPGILLSPLFRPNVVIPLDVVPILQRRCPVAGPALDSVRVPTTQF